MQLTLHSETLTSINAVVKFQNSGITLQVTNGYVCKAVCKDNDMIAITKQKTHMFITPLNALNYIHMSPLGQTALQKLR